MVSLRAFGVYFTLILYILQVFSQDPETNQFLKPNGYEINVTPPEDVATSVIFNCNVGDFSGPEVKTRMRKIKDKDGVDQDILIQPKTSGRWVVTGFYTYNLTNVNVGDSGTYFCDIFDHSSSTPIPGVSKEISLVVNVAPHNLEVNGGYRGDAVDLPKDGTVYVDSNKDVLTCAANGNPKPAVQFTYEVHKGTIPPSVMLAEGSNTLQINHSKLPVGSTVHGFFCNAKNTEGEKKIKITIKKLGVPTFLPAEGVKDEKVNLNILAQGVSSNQFKFSGLPTPVIKFLKDGQELTVPDYSPKNPVQGIAIAQSGAEDDGVNKVDILITNPTGLEAGRYEIHLTNSFGDASMQLQFSALPLVPTINSGDKSDSDSSYRLSFKVMSVLAPTKCAYLLNQVGSPNKPVVEAEVTKGSDADNYFCTVDNLKHSTQYSVSVAARNLEGLGSYSEPRVFTTAKGNEGVTPGPSYSEVPIQQGTTTTSGSQALGITLHASLLLLAATLFLR